MSNRIHVCAASIIIQRKSRLSPSCRWQCLLHERGTGEVAVREYTIPRAQLYDKFSAPELGIADERVGVQTDGERAEAPSK